MARMVSNVCPSKMWMYRRKRDASLIIAILALLSIVVCWIIKIHTTFYKIENMDFPGIGDFSCPNSEENGKCVFKSDRKVRMSDKPACARMGETCKGFAFNSGKQMIILKTSLGTHPVYSPGMELYIKKSYVSAINLTIEDCAPAIDQDKSSTAAISSGMACNLPKLDPFDKAVMPLIRDKEPLECPNKLVTKLENGVLVFDPKGNNVQEVTYQTIVRKNGDFGHGVGREGKLTRTDNTVVLNHDAVRVIFTNDKGEKQTDFHIEVSPLPGVTARGTKTPGLPINIMVIAFDSTSQSHFLRKLPRVKTWLDKELSTFTYKGFSTVGDGTTPAMIGLLTGKLEEELPEARRSRGGVHVDVWPFVFSKLHDYGYVTEWSEDQAKYGTFQYRLEGFKEKPVDHFLRNFWVAVNAHTGNAGSWCLGAEPAFKKRFRYMQSYYKNYPKAKFSLDFFSIGHDDINDLGYVEEDFVNFLTEMKSNGHFDNTMLFIMGDHGIRYGAIRSTIIGKLEERLPYLSVSVPKWFRTKYPEIIEALGVNTERLTSPFDLHATIHHILQYPAKPTVDVGQSLLIEVPKSRTCKESGIPVHYCTCMDWRRVTPEHHHVQNLGKAAVQHINDRIRKERLTDKCALLEFKGIHNAVYMSPSNDVQSFSGSDDMFDRLIFKGAKPKGMCNYQIQLHTSPNKGIFEVTGYVSSYVPHINPQMSRLDAYGDQPKCIMDSHPHMREVCYCLGT